MVGKQVNLPSWKADRLMVYQIQWHSRAQHSEGSVLLLAVALYFAPLLRYHLVVQVCHLLLWSASTQKHLP